MRNRLDVNDRLGLVHPYIDAHTLGIAAIHQILGRCGISIIQAPRQVNEALNQLGDDAAARSLRDWVVGSKVTALGFSFRLDAQEGLRLFSQFMATLKSAKLLSGQGGSVDFVAFAGLPPTCDLVYEAFPGLSAYFKGDESTAEALEMLGINGSMLEEESALGMAYDESRLRLGREIINAGAYASLAKVARNYPLFGKRGDTVVARVDDGVARNLPPLMRAHAGPFLPDRVEAVRLFVEWARTLAASGLLDVLSIGTSQLSQEAFGQDWSGRVDGGGVPVNSVQEFKRIWEAARPMLVRSYSGTSNVVEVAKVLESSIDIAWHALSLWWFNRMDGRGPMSVKQGLQEHCDDLKYIAATSKPFEPNVPHHFAFRGADDESYVLSGYLAARTAKNHGIRVLVLQIMLNTPRYTWGICDLAKAKALCAMVRSLEDRNFRVILQPRGGLDYFSHDSTKAKAQLAAVTAMMDDIEGEKSTSPEIIHVVSYSEGYAHADPDVIDESLKITRYALSRYRELKNQGNLPDMGADQRVLERTKEIVDSTKAMLRVIEELIPDPWCAQGLYRILEYGFFALPWLAECRDEFPQAVRWDTACIDGKVVCVDALGKPLNIADRIGAIREAALAKKHRAAS